MTVGNVENPISIYLRFHLGGRSESQPRQDSTRIGSARSGMLCWPEARALSVLLVLLVATRSYRSGRKKPAISGFAVTRSSLQLQRAFGNGSFDSGILSQPLPASWSVIPKRVKYEMERDSQLDVCGWTNQQSVIGNLLLPAVSIKTSLRSLFRSSCHPQPFEPCPTPHAPRPSRMLESCSSLFVPVPHQRIRTNGSAGKCRERKYRLPHTLMFQNN